jgi:hypothetical protein
VNVAGVVKLDRFEVVLFKDGERTVVVIYALGRNGILYEMSGGRWLAMPVFDHTPTFAQTKEGAAT